MLIKLFSDASGDYREILRKRSRVLLAMSIVGLLTLAVSLVLGVLGVLTDDGTRGFYAGAGTGLGVSALIGFIGTRRTMKNEKKLRADQIKETDERSKYVMLRAFSLAAFWFLACAYGALMIAVAVDRTVAVTMLAVIAVFFVVWGLCWRYCNKRL